MIDRVKFTVDLLIIDANAIFMVDVKVLRFLSERQKREPEAYDEWYKEFNSFIKEGESNHFIFDMKRHWRYHF